MQLFQNLIVSLLPRDESFAPSRTERLYVVIFKSTFENLTEVQDGSVCAADLEILIDHPSDLSSLEEAFFQTFVLLLLE